MTDTADLRAAREHAALLRDLEALCRKYTACTPRAPLASDLAIAMLQSNAGRLWQLPDDPFDITEWLSPPIPDDAATNGPTYIAGPMSGYDDHNYPAFNAMAEQLRGAGLQVINPAELHPDTTHPWGWYLRRDLAELVKCSRVVFLDGWFNSRGARLEHHVAAALDLHLVYPDEVEAFIRDRFRCIGCGAIDQAGCPTGECSR